MSPDPSQYLPVDASDEPSAPAGFAWPDDATVLFTLARTSPSVTPPTYKLTLDELRTLIVGAAAVPAVTLTSPLTGTTVIIGRPLLLQATVTSVIALASVEFFIGTTSLGMAVANGSLYTMVYTPESGSTLNVSVHARDTNGGISVASAFVFLLEPVIFSSTITGFTPVTGPVGTLVTLTGTHLSGASVLTIGGVAVTSFVVLSDTSISLVTPDYGGGMGQFSVTTPLGTAVSASSFLTPVVLRVPGAPTTLNLVPGVGSLTFSYQAPLNTGGAPITAYQIFRNTSPNVYATSTGLSFTDTYVTAGTFYSYSVRAVNSVGAGPASDTSLLATPTVQVTTYSATQSFTATCGTGTSGAPVTRSATRTSTVSLADATSLALAAATADANAALVCTPNTVTYQAVSQSFTTTAQDFVTKCGAGTTGTAVTRSSTTGTSTVSQAAANSLALQDATSQAIAAISCPVPAPTFNRTLNPGENVSTVTYNGTTGSQFQFNVPLSASTAPNPATMLLYFPAGTQIGQVDYNGADTGTQCAVLLNGIQHLTTFTNGSVTLT